jgi:hypothetical protein
VDIIRERGAATRGRAARAVAGAGAVEVKATVPAHQVAAALELFDLTPDEDDERYIYFFDTPDLALLEQGVVARARRRVGAEHDSTIKFRPVDPEQVPAHWRKYEGFKIEADANDRKVVRSASLTMPVRKGLIKAVVAGEVPIAQLFTEEQVNFLLTLAEKRFDPSHLVVLGPIRAWKWKLEVEALPWPLTVELWRRPDGEEILECSIKAPAAQAAVAYFGFMAFLAELGAERDEGQTAKTHWAVDHFIAQHRAAEAPAAAQA